MNNYKIFSSKVLCKPHKKYNKFYINLVLMLHGSLIIFFFCLFCLSFRSTEYKNMQAKPQKQYKMKQLNNDQSNNLANSTCIIYI